MIHFIAGSPRGSVAFAAFVAVAILSGMCESGHAQDARTKARNTIRLCKANISKATAQIVDRSRRITAGNILIAVAEAAVREAMKKKNNEAAVGTLQLSLAALKSKRNSLVKEKQDWERYRSSQTKLLAEWEAYLRKLGG